MGIEVDWSPTERLQARLERLQRPFETPEARAAFERIGQILVEDNRAARLAGVDAAGAAMPTPKPSTRRPGAGPYLAPREDDSRVVTGFRVEIQQTGDGVTIAAGWDGVGFLRYYPRIRGVRPEAKAGVAGELERLRQTLMTGGQG